MRPLSTSYKEEPYPSMCCMYGAGTGAVGIGVHRITHLARLGVPRSGSIRTWTCLRDQGVDSAATHDFRRYSHAE